MKVFEGYKKGVNLGGWLSQCGEDNYTEEHYNSFIKEEDIKTIASWGLDHVRMPVDYNVLESEDGVFDEKGFKHVDDCISWCKKYNLKIVFDLHKTRGYVFDDEEYVGFFDDKALQDQFVALWEEIIRRYKDEHEMMSFELLNEVTEERFAKKWNEIADRTIKAIRKISTDVKIILGGIYNSSIYGLTLLDPPADENVVYTFHCYNPLIFTHQNAPWVKAIPHGYQLHYPIKVKDIAAESHKYFGADFDNEFTGLDPESMMSEEFFYKLFEPALKKAREYDVALYCGEYGVIDQATPEETVAWYKDINTALVKHDISRAAWSYKRMDFGLSDDRLKGVLPQILKLL